MPYEGPSMNPSQTTSPAPQIHQVYPYSSVKVNQANSYYHNFNSKGNSSLSRSGSGISPSGAVTTAIGTALGGRGSGTSSV